MDRIEHPPATTAPQPAPAGAEPEIAPVGEDADPVMASIAEPELNPSTRVLWRSSTSLQFELGRRQVILDGIRPEEAQRLLARTRHASAPPSTEADRDDPRLTLRLSQARRLLRAAGLTMPGELADSAPPAPRLAGELAALRQRHGGAATDVLDGRAKRVVVIDGPSALAAGLGAVLAGAGVGQVHVRGDGWARLTHCGPGGVSPADEGAPYSEAAAQALRRAAPDVRAQAPSTTQHVDLRVLAGEPLVDPDLSLVLHRQHQAHLAVWSGGDRGVVGPLVLPGRTTCLRCTDLHRLDRDRGWSALAAQLSVTPPRAQPHDVALGTTMTGVAAQQILAYLDGEACATAGATLELLPPDWRLRRRTWPPHPDCDCGAFTTQTGPDDVRDDRR